MSDGFKIVVEGDYACFTRPEMKMERVSYDVPTPGALEGLIKNIYWKPAIRIVIDKIVVFNPIEFISVKRNEKENKVSIDKVNQKMKDSSKEIGDFNICQRTSVVLKKVKYGIEFHFEMTGIRSENEDEGEYKHCEIFKRRLKKGQCFRQPSFGLREFVVKKIKLVDEFNYSEVDKSLKGKDVDLGYMLYKVEFKDKGIPIDGDWERGLFSDEADAIYYRPHMIDGIIDVKKYREGCRC